MKGLWITRVETIKRQTWALVAVWPQGPKSSRLYGLLAARPLCLQRTAPLQLQYASCGAI